MKSAWSRNTLCASAVAVGASLCASSFAADPVRFWNYLGWVDGSETCLDQGTGANCNPDSLLEFADNVGALGADAFELADWRNFAAGDGQAPDSPVSSLRATGQNNNDAGVVLNPGDEVLLSSLVHDNNVLSPFGEFFQWEMTLLADLQVDNAVSGDGVYNSGDEVFDFGDDDAFEGAIPFQFQFLETLNTDPCDLTDNPLGSTCDDRWLGINTALLIANIPLLGEGFHPGAELQIRAEPSGNIDFQQVGLDLEVHTAEPLDSTLEFFIRYEPGQVKIPEPSSIALFGATLVLLGGMRRARRG